VHQGIADKIKVFNEILERYNLDKSEVAYIGDDVNDLEILEQIGFSVSVRDGIEQVRKEVDYVTRSVGGQGAVRELAEVILNAK